MSRMQTIQPFEVSKLLNDLKSKAGYSDAKIGLNVSAPASIITRLRTGVIKECGLKRGIRIANFHAQVFKAKQ